MQGICRTTSSVLALATLLSLQAHGVQEGSDPGACETLRTYNATGNKIWVTVYDLAKTTHLDYGWVDACSVRTWRSGNYTCGSYYHVRAEVKPYDVNGPNVFDTNVETNPQGGDYSSWGVTLRRSGTTNNYYWEHGNTSGCLPGFTTCCGTTYLEPQGSPVHYDPPPPPPPANVQFTFDNTTKYHALVVPYVAMPNTVVDNIMFDPVCVPPNSKKTWTLVGYWDYRVRVTPHGQGCDDGKPLITYVGETKTVNGAASINYAYDPKTRYFSFPP